MNRKRLRYHKLSKNTHSSRDKDCFEFMVTDAKSEIVHQIQRIGKNSFYHKYITLTLKAIDEKRKQRKLGQLYDKMIKKWNYELQNPEFLSDYDDDTDESISELER